MALTVEYLVAIDGMEIRIVVEGERLLAVGDQQLAAARAADRAHAGIRAALLEPLARRPLDADDAGP